MRAPEFKIGNNEAWTVFRKGPAWNACVGFWYVRLPGYHPMLEWFTVIVNHLRDEVGTPRPNKNQASATHEIIIAAVNPEPWLDAGKEFDPDDESVWSLMVPLDIVQQLDNLTDLKAANVGLHAVRLLLSGTLRPDREKFHDWLKVFNDFVFNLNFGPEIEGATQIAPGLYVGNESKSIFNLSGKGKLR